MKLNNFKITGIAKLGLLLLLTFAVSACAGLPDISGKSWKEEVLLHDGSKIIVTRTVDRGGRHEVGQKPPYKEQTLTFTMPGTKQEITWEDKFSEDLGSANFLPMLLDVSNDIVYLVANPMGCLSYNKWGRPNPPYVIFKYLDKEWQRIPMQELPVEIKTPNLIFSMPDVMVEKSGKSFMTAEMIRAITAGYAQSEYKTILREPIKGGGDSGCPEMIRYKCGWGGPGEFNRKYFERVCK
jgi:hypothetical protein